MVCNCGVPSVNWSQKVLDIYSKVKDEMDLKSENIENIVISIQTRSENSIEPVFIVGEDDVFLDVNILCESTGRLQPAVICKDQIQCIKYLGYIKKEEESKKVPDFEEVLLSILDSIPDECLISVKEHTL